MIGIMWPLVPIFLLAILSGYFSVLETALSESRHGRIEKLAESGDKAAEKVLKMIESPRKFLAVARIGITVTGIFAGAFAIVFANLIFTEINFLVHAEIISVIISISITAILMLLIGSSLPIRAAQQIPEDFLLQHQKSFRLIVTLLNPLVEIFSAIASGVMIIFGMNAEKSETVTADEVKDLIEQGTEDGTFEESEREMVDKIFYLSDQTAYALMTPRVKMVWLDLLDSMEKNLKVVRENRQNIFPVGEGSLDKCRGVIYAKDVLDAALDNNIDLPALIKKPMFVPRTMETFRLVEKFKSSGETVAIVNDEYGGVIGFITIDDIAQEIVGIVEQSEDKKFIPQKNNAWAVEGLCAIDDFKKKFNFESLPDEERDHYKTMGGFVTSLFGYIPKVGDKKDWENFRFEVLKMDRARIDKILITKFERID